MCLFLCIFFAHISILKKVFFEQFFSKVFLATSPSECAWCEKVEFAGCATEMGRDNRHIRGEYMCATLTPRRSRARQQQKQKAREKRNNTKCCIRFVASTVRETFGYVRCDSEKTLFINIVLRYIDEAGNRCVLSLSSFSTFFSSPLYRIKWWIFACPRRLFQKHSATLASKRFGAWVLLFSRFSCFCGPEKKEK